MKKSMIVMMFLLCLLLISCQQSSPSTSSETSAPNKEASESKEIVPLTIAQNDFHFVVGWFTNEEVLYVTKEQEMYNIIAYNIYNGQQTIIYEDSSIISDVFIHPKNNHLLVQTTDHAQAANLKVLTYEGETLHTATIESSEIAVEWHSENPNYILITAFNEDWSFEVLFYNSETNDMHVIKTNDPFPNWLHERNILTLEEREHSLEESSLFMSTIDNERSKIASVDTISFMTTYASSVLIGEVLEEDVVRYSLLNGELEPVWSYEVPLLANYSEWVFSDVSWQSEDTVILAVAEEGGHVDDVMAGFNLVKITPEGIEQLAHVDEPYFTCQSSGDICLTGFQLDNVLIIERQQQEPWITIQ